jgi:hypothetical protein
MNRLKRLLANWLINSDQPDMIELKTTLRHLETAIGVLEANVKVLEAARNRDERKRGHR